MQGGRRGGGSFFGYDPFADFGGFGGLGSHSNMLSSFFGGRDPFDDPFFTRPFGSPFASMFEPGVFGPNSSPFAGAAPSGFIEHQEPQHNKRRGPVIEEINSDDEKVEGESASKTKDNPRKHLKLDKQPYVEVPDDEADGGRNKHILHRNEFSNIRQPQSQSQSFTFQSSTVSYGGTNGAYYTKSMTKRTGSDGVSFEEFKEADSTTGHANHRVSRGLHDMGHTLSRKLNHDGRVDSMQMLHNLNEDELTGFEQAWEGSAGRHLSGWRQSLEGGNNTGKVEPSGGGQVDRRGWALPSTQRVEHPGSGNPRMVNGNEAAYMPRTGRRAADRGSYGRTRA